VAVGDRGRGRLLPSWPLHMVSINISTVLNVVTEQLYWYGLWRGTALL